MPRSSAKPRDEAPPPFDIPKAVILSVYAPGEENQRRADLEKLAINAGIDLYPDDKDED